MRISPLSRVKIVSPEVDQLSKLRTNGIDSKSSPISLESFKQCCNLTDHIRLPIIHTKIYRNIHRYKREEQIG